MTSIPGVVLTLLFPMFQADVPPKVRDWQVSGPTDKCVDVLFVGDGYVADDLTSIGKFWIDVNRYASRLLEIEPFEHYQKHFNIRGMYLASSQRGCDESSDGDNVNTALDSRFDTKTGRLLIFKNKDRLTTLVKGAGEVDIVFVMVNTERYGGAGTVLTSIQIRGSPLPAPTFSARDTTSFMIAVHEIGHSFAHLADEYADEQEQQRHRLPEAGVDLTAANVTTPSHFDAKSFTKLAETVKWRHFLSLPGASKRKWLFEGGYYRREGVFRPWRTCRMLGNGEPFCPVCDEEVAKAIATCCGDTWDDVAWHKARPLSDWK